MNEKIEEFKKELYPVYLQDQVHSAVQALATARDDIDAHRALIAKTPEKYKDGLTNGLREQLWEIQEVIAVKEVKAWKKKLKRYAVDQKFIEPPDDEFDIERLKEVPIPELCSFERSHPIHGGIQALCPFHKESTPSFTYYSESNSYYCFSCAEGGDNIKFVMRDRELNFRDACKLLNTMV